MRGVKRQLKNTSKMALRRLFEQGQRLGIDVLPRHFYSEIPAIHEMRQSERWKAPFTMIGVAGAEMESQLEFVKSCCPPPIIEEIKAKSVLACAAEENGETGFGLVEADFLFAFVATKKPRQIFQIGCGVSTAICLMAADYAGYTPDVICIEPYPTRYMVHQAKEGRITLISKKAQAVDVKVVEALDNDLLFFVDSSHTLGPAGEVSRIILEMLPRLKPGARVHFHDITFPYDYDRTILTSTLFFWHESVLLHAFLSYNDRFRILTCLSMLHYGVPEALSQYLPNYRPAENDQGLGKSEGHFPSSTYLAVVA